MNIFPQVMREMKIILALLGLVQFFQQTDGLVCREVEDWSEIPFEHTQKNCSEGVTTCARPKFTNGAFAEKDPDDSAAVIWGCGECGRAESCISSTYGNWFMICLIDEPTAAINLTSEMICNDVEVIDPETSAVIVPAETSCKRPRIDSDGNFMTGGDAKWGCGKCPDGSDSCVSCVGPGCTHFNSQMHCYTDETRADENRIRCGDVEVIDPETSAVILRSETSCKRPRIDSDGNFMTGGDAEWGCGKCPDGSDSCVSCDGWDCNKFGYIREYNCFKYEKSNDGTWIKDDVTTEVTCKSELGEKYCKMPTPDNTAVEWNSCGSNCHDEQCKSCYGRNCNDRDRSTYEWCKVGPADTIQAEVANLPLKFCSGTLGCQRPRIEYGKPVENAADYKCFFDQADCIDGKCEFCDQGNACNTYPVNNHKCYDWSWKTNQYVAGDLQDCNRGDATITRCNMPKDLQNQAAYTPETNNNGCGQCSTEQADNCITTFAEDNRTPTRNQCYTWTWSTSKYEIGDPVDCNALDDPEDPIICNIPRDLAIQNSYDYGCGRCSNKTVCNETQGARSNVPSEKQCYAWLWETNKYVQGVLRNCMRKSEFRCNKPRDVTDKNAYDPTINENGCGECSSSQAIGCITTPDSRNDGKTTLEHQCFSWSWVGDRYQPGRLIECSQDRDWKEVFRSSKCNMPSKPEDKNSYIPEVNVNGCGPCVESDCITTFSGENEPTHKCYGWTQGEEGWIPSETLMNCYQADTAENDLKCSLPRYRSNKDGFNLNGCGPCPEAEANMADENVEYNCISTDPEKNSGIQVMISFLIALILTWAYTVLY